MKTKTKQTIRTGTESENGHHMEGFQWGEGREEWGEGKVQGRRSIIGRHQVDGERSKTVGNRKLTELICTMDMDINLKEGDARGLVVQGGE